MEATSSLWRDPGALGQGTPEVDAFLGNPAAVALWGDMGRRLLQRWIEIYAGTA